MKHILGKYTIVSRKEINKEKYNIFLFNTDPSMVEQIYIILDFNKGTLPYKYLGLPLKFS